MESELLLQSDSNFMPVKSCIFNVFLFIFQAIQFYMFSIFNGMMWGRQSHCSWQEDFGLYPEVTE